MPPAAGGPGPGPRELAELGADEASAADVPGTVTARVGAALQAVPRKRAVPPPPSGHRVLGASGRKAAHAARGSRPRSRRLRRLGALAGLFAAVVAVGLGAVMLVRRRHPPRPAGRPPSTSPSRPRRTVYRCPTRRSSGCLPTGPTTGRSPTRNAERPASTAWAIRRPPRCSVPGPWTSRPPRCVAGAARRHGQDGGRLGGRTQLQRCRHRITSEHGGHAPVIDASSRRGTPGPRLMFVPVPTSYARKGPHDLHIHRP